MVKKFKQEKEIQSVAKLKSLYRAGLKSCPKKIRSYIDSLGLIKLNFF